MPVRAHTPRPPRRAEPRTTGRRSPGRIFSGLATVTVALAAASPGLAAPGAGKAAPLPLSLGGQTSTTLTLRWTPPPGAKGYVFLVDGKRVSRTLDPGKSTVRFRKGPARFEVRTLIGTQAGIWPDRPLPAKAPSDKVGLPAGLDTSAWQILQQTNQTDLGSGPGNRYTFGWVKSKRPSPTRPANEGVVEFADYPGEFVMVELKRFDLGYPGRVTNFHLVGGDEVHGGVSPLSADYRPGRSPDWPADLPVGLVLTSQASLDEGRRGHWLLLGDGEITADRSAVWTFVWRIRWGANATGAVSVEILRNGVFVRTVSVPRVSTRYAEQQPRLYVWLGGYESTGLVQPAAITQSLDHRGRTLEEALADRPRLGSSARSVSTSGGPDSSVTPAGTLVRPDATMR